MADEQNNVLAMKEAPRMRRKPRPQAPPSLSFLEAEDSFLKAIDTQKANGRGRGRTGRPPHAGVLAEALKRNNVEYFRYILDDETEKELWLLFMTGKQVLRDVDGKPLMEKVDVNGEERMFPVLQEVELNPISLKAFLRAVEYKRGQPVNIDPNKDMDTGFKVVFETVGAGQEFFLEHGKSTGLIKE